LAEREGIARDLHDLGGGTLTLVALKADLAKRLLAVNQVRAAEELGGIATAAREGLAEVRATLSGMAGTSLAREMEASRDALAAAGIAADVVGDASAVVEDSAAILAMTLREAITNVIRHAEASHCRVALSAGIGEARLLGRARWRVDGFAVSSRFLSVWCPQRPTDQNRTPNAFGDSVPKSSTTSGRDTASSTTMILGYPKRLRASA